MSVYQLSNLLSKVNFGSKIKLLTSKQMYNIYNINITYVYYVYYYNICTEICTENIFIANMKKKITH